MGLLSSIGHAVSGVFHGISKVFKGIMKPVGKFLNSKLGKTVMIAAAVFTAGMALYAGYSAFAASSGSFIDSFMAGGNAFVTALAHPIATAEGMFGAGATAGTVAGAGAEAAGGAATATADAAAATAADTAAVAPAAAGGAAAAAPAAAGGAAWGSTPIAAMEATRPAAAAAGVGGGLLDFAKSTGGGLLLGSTIQGYGQGAAQEAMLKKQAQALQLPNQQWAPGAPGVADLQTQAGKPINVSTGYLNRAKLVSDFLAGRSPSITGPTMTPDQVSQLAVAPSQAVQGTPAGGILQTG